MDAEVSRPSAPAAGVASMQSFAVPGPGHSRLQISDGAEGTASAPG